MKNIWPNSGMIFGFGLLICGTGIGISMAANKFKGIRAGLCSTTYQARMTRRQKSIDTINRWLYYGTYADLMPAASVLLGINL